MARITYWLGYEWSERELTSATNTMQMSDLHLYFSCVQRALSTAVETADSNLDWIVYNHGRGWRFKFLFAAPHPDTPSPGQDMCAARAWLSAQRMELAPWQPPSLHKWHGGGYWIITAFAPVLKIAITDIRGTRSGYSKYADCSTLSLI